jgi:hypothetical protein
MVIQNCSNVELYTKYKLNVLPDVNWYSILNFRMMWTAGILAAISSITYPAISAFVSTNADPDKQGLNLKLQMQTEVNIGFGNA